MEGVKLNMGKNTMELTDSNFLATVEKSEKPVLVDFWAPWCGPCRLLSPIVEELAQVYEGKLQVAKVNTDESPSVATQFNIRSIPTLLFFKDGKLVDSMIGLVPRDQLQEKIETILNK
jgi:thioredoxin 1